MTSANVLFLFHGKDPASVSGSHDMVTQSTNNPFWNHSHSFLLQTNTTLKTEEKKKLFLFLFHFPTLTPHFLRKNDWKLRRRHWLRQLLRPHRRPPRIPRRRNSRHWHYCCRTGRSSDRLLVHRFWLAPCRRHGVFRQHCAGPLDGALCSGEIPNSSDISFVHLCAENAVTWVSCTCCV